MSWNLSQALPLIRQIELVCPAAGCHVALTGGVLYKSEDRKDLDLLFYRIRQKEEIHMNTLWVILAELGIDRLSGFGWCYKATYHGKPIDIFFPEEQDGGDYNPEHPKQ
jgi:hypothetical protein